MKHLKLTRDVKGINWLKKKIKITLVILNNRGAITRSGNGNVTKDV